MSRFRKALSCPRLPSAGPIWRSNDISRRIEPRGERAILRARFRPFAVPAMGWLSGRPDIAKAEKAPPGRPSNHAAAPLSYRAVIGGKLFIATVGPATLP